jgi:hypothetical protein
VRRLLELSGAHVIGTVMNKIDARHAQYYGYYGPYAQGDAYPAGHVAAAK